MMNSVGPALRVKKGAGLWGLAEQIRISPAPKLGGVAGRQLRFLSVSRGQSVITDLEQGSFAQSRRLTGLPLMHRMWFQEDGYSLGYTKKQKIGHASELFFLDAEARVLSLRQLPDAVSEVASGAGQWYLGCRDGTLYVFSLEGAHLWSHVIPFERRDQCRNALFGLPVFQPYLQVTAAGPGVVIGAVTAAGPGVVIGAEDEFCAFDRFGHRTFRWSLPSIDRSDRNCGRVDAPAHDERLERLWICNIGDQRMRTGYFRYALDATQDAGWVKETAVFDDPVEETGGVSEEWGEDDIRVVVPFASDGIKVMRSSWNRIFVGARNGFLHIFDHRGARLQTFHLGRNPVTDILADQKGVRAAYSAGCLTLFDGRQITGSVVLPEYFANLAFCGELVLVWRWKSAWLVDGRGRVLWAGETEKPIRAAWGDAGGFYLLAGPLLSLRPMSPENGLTEIET